EQVPRQSDERDCGDDQSPQWHEQEIRRAPACAPLFRKRMRCKPEARNRGVDAADKPCRGKQSAIHEKSLQFAVNSSQLEELQNCGTAELPNCKASKETTQLRDEKISGELRI